GGSCENAWWRDGLASCRSSRHSRTSGRGADAPTPNQVSDIPRIRARSALRYGWVWRAHIRRAVSSRDLGSTRGGAPAPGELGVQRRRHLRALSDGGGDALDRTRAYVADGELAR